MLSKWPDESTLRHREGNNKATPINLLPSAGGIRIYAVKGNWYLGNSLLRKVVAMVFVVLFVLVLPSVAPTTSSHA
jgi:hypothetical protein